LKENVYTVEVEDSNNLLSCIPVAVTNTRDWPRQQVHVGDSAQVALKQCMEAEGGNIKQFL
jgi:hypothetical protein